MTYQELLAWGKEKLQDAGVLDYDLDARLLMEYVFEISRSRLLCDGALEAPKEGTDRYRVLLEKRCSRIPLQHLTGQQDFMGLTFTVNENVLIPRQDTEILVEEVLRELHDGMHIIDVCTGSGCILISLLRYSNECHGVGDDLSAEALAVARENAERLIPQADYSFCESDLLQEITGKFDILVSNPPYIASNVIEGLMPEVREHEPRMALDGGEDGLVFYRRILKEGLPHLMGGAKVFFEIGYDQGEAVKIMMEEMGFMEVRVVKDYAGLDRVVTGTWHSGDGL